LNIDRRLGQVFDDRPGTAARVADPREDGAQAPLKIMTQELVFYARQWLDLNRETVRRMKNRSDRIILLFIGLLAVALGTLSLLLIRSLVPPLEALRKGTRIIGSGQLDFKLHVPARNEMGELAEGFNQMGDQLKTARESLHKALNRSLQSEKDLKNYQNHLKDVVHQRTQDLWEANKLLEKQIQERQGAET
ncbi:MAG: HAMP domain-containing protein, partial [Nitrospinaceae bacterium]|nr:HAMP domain-containing protein [Nitrospinaceae bacterium]NIR55068.1 HAMP domain-containing protein [Nitrospinaceae bacterium]NIS85477.1 HAMP domain-containing protein [Nitrospinaceae bacterium]NIT82315.1 HAMP domain-containing protein [Nitrospinaceae bacterium]NIU44533.1 HAMP domain-containing protein [Nitrospinaceae bacterium]